MHPRNTKPFPPDAAQRELLDTAPGRPAFLRPSDAGAEPPGPSGADEPHLPGLATLPDPNADSPLFDDLLSAAKETPAIPERADSGGARSARYAGEGRPQKARQETLPTGEVLVAPLDAEARAHAAATADPRRKAIDLEAFVRDPGLRAAPTAPSLHVVQVARAGDQAERRRRGLAIGIGVAVGLALLGIGLVLFGGRSGTPPGATVATVSSAAVSVHVPTPQPSVRTAPPVVSAAPVASAMSAPVVSAPRPAPVSTAAVSPAARPIPSAAPAPPSSPTAAPSDITHNIN